MDAESSSIVKLPRLNKPADYIQWKRRLYAFLRRDDPPLVGPKEDPNQASEAERQEWLKRSIKAKSNIILSLGDSALAQTRLIIDDDNKTAKELWEALAKT